MTVNLECLECGAPAESYDECCFEAVDFDGRDCWLYADKIRCAAGHDYHLVDESRTTYS